MSTSGWRRISVRLAVAVVAAVLGAGVALAVGGSVSVAKGTRVLQVPPFASQPNPVTPPADVRWHTTIKFSGPFGGTGSNSVCDRELLIRYLIARPARMRAWAHVEGVAPNPTAVSRFIRSLDPATLIRDTRVTDYSYANGRAYGFQAILQAGTAVLVDSLGNIRARCRCGNPLAYPVLYAVETCIGCTAGYTLPLTSGPSFVDYPDPPPVLGQTQQQENTDETTGARGKKVTGRGRGSAKTRTVTVTTTVTQASGVTTTVPVTVTRNVTLPAQTVTSTVTQTVQGSVTHG